MPIDLATLSLLGALQALLLAPMLFAATHAYTGLARNSLRIWATVLLFQALGWMLLGLRGQISDWLSIALANGLLIISYAETTRALRLLLGLPQRRLLLVVIGTGCWLGIAWFGQIHPDYRMRVYFMALAVASYLPLLLWPLRQAARRGGSTAQRVMLLVLLGACAVWFFRLYALASGHGPDGLLTPSPANVVNLIYSAIEPVFASIGFLLMYNETAQAELRRLARIDPLTGVLNRLALDEEAQRLFRQPLNRTRGCAALMADVDHFKAINDRFGHADGDRVLTTLAACIGNGLRSGDVLGRVGGEEFLALLPDTDMGMATAIAEDLRAAVANLHLQLGGEVQAITLSIGVAVREPTDIQPQALMRRADHALYAAKRAGRNRVATSLPDRRDNTLENSC